MSGSTDLIVYLNYIQEWDSATDANITSLLNEHNLFLNVGDYNSEQAVNNEFNTLVGLAQTVEAVTIAADATQMAADAAAITAFWSFGLGMVAFVALEAAEIAERAVISSKSTELNQKLATADVDISANINENVKQYIAMYKTNNNMIYSQAPQGLNTQTCRADLLQFMAEIEKKEPLNAQSFRKWAGSARKIFNSNEINIIYDALDRLNLSEKSQEDINKFIGTLKGFRVPGIADGVMSLVRNGCYLIAYNKMNIAKKALQSAAEDAGIPVEELGETAFKAMDVVGKFATCIAIVMTVVDIILQIIDMVNIIEQCNKMTDELNNTIRQNYLNFFDGIKDASQKYKQAISPPVNNSHNSLDYSLLLL